MQRLVLVLARLMMLALPWPLEAATPYEDEVPIELARYFLPGNWYSDLPPGFPEIVIPGGIELIGSQDQTQRKQVLFRSTVMNTPAAQELLAEAISREAGWARMEYVNDNAPRAGFVPANYEAPMPAIQLCSEVQGLLTVTSRAAGFVHMNFSAPEIFNNRPCTERVRMLMRIVGNGATYMDYVPVLELANGTGSTPPQLSVSNSSANPFSYNTDSFITADTSLRKLGNNFAQQMRGQGWRRISGWRGRVSTGHQWTRQLPDGNSLQASLEILRVAENDFSLRMQVLQTAQVD